MLHQRNSDKTITVQCILSNVNIHRVNYINPQHLKEHQKSLYIASASNCLWREKEKIYQNKEKSITCWKMAEKGKLYSSMKRFLLLCNCNWLKFVVSFEANQEAKILGLVREHCNIQNVNEPQNISKINNTHLRANIIFSELHSSLYLKLYNKIVQSYKSSCLRVWAYWPYLWLCALSQKL